MKLFSRQKSVDQVPPELQPYYAIPAANAQANRRRQLLLIVLIVAAVLLIAGLTVAINHFSHDTTSPKLPTPIVQQNPSTQTQDPTATPKPSAAQGQGATPATTQPVVLPNTGDDVE